MAKIDNIERAARLARAMASDISIYNTDRIRRGIENDRLFEELEDDLREGLKMWDSKIAPEIVNGTNLIQKAVIDIIFAGQKNVRSKIF